MKIIVATAALALCTGLGLSSWKMFEFHDRLNEIENTQWEQKLDVLGVYRDRRIVMFGDSQIKGWPMATSFGVLPIMNRGVNGDWATKAVDRFEHDAMSLKPQTLVLLMGTNDIGHEKSPQEIAASVLRMAKHSIQHGAAVIICSVLPVRGEFVSNHPAAKIRELNELLRVGAAEVGAKWLDLHSAMAGSDGLIRPEVTADGLHANADGYVLMTAKLLPLLYET